MASIARIRATWTGFPGAPGVSTFYASPVGDLGTQIRAFFYGVRNLLPVDVHIQVENTGDVINDVTGELVDTWGGTVQAVVDGTLDDAYSAPAGAMVAWETDTVTDRHRLFGKTFIVPLAGSMYQNDGSLSTVCLGDLNTAATTLVSASGGLFYVWHRPRLAHAADGSRPAITARDGSHAVVTHSRVPDKSVVLRSRRD